MDSNKIKLLKFLVDSDIGSRRYCFNLIRAGKVSVNNKTITQPLYLITPETDKIKVENKEIKIKKEILEPVYIMMNKPAGVICSLKDKKGRPTIFDLLKHKNLKRKHLFYTGRLDFKTEGLIFITNDGEFANFITHPRYNVLKYYYVEIKKMLTDDEIKRMKKGIYTKEEIYKIKDLKIISRDEKHTNLIIVLNEGKNREIRKIFQVLKHKIKYLKRTRIGPFRLDPKLKPGEYKLISKRIIEKFKKELTTSK